ncbi:type IIG restriction enzyme/methyltransferase [Priestia megaterium]|uniref:type IIG restriction enzyme/methyltransferase n=1 Tax=Priestia megaterium TaxID=1404 RepID=UPI00207B0C51|nr:TaqI-like C-terminal specificity domain-containing protein [Priestia megaterium]USL39603.1 Eco57I restriction-modification methylase domain-containing protein [Priestia megaterium]
MSIEFVDLKDSLPKNIQAMMPLEDDKDRFNKNLNEYLTNLSLKSNETEEYQKGLLTNFLNQTNLKGLHFINTNERADLAIFNGANVESKVGVLIEVKSTSNKSEMVSKKDMNRKAFRELLSYYLRERVTHENIEIKKAIITNGYEWFIFNSTELEKHFINNSELVRNYKLWKEKGTSGTTTAFLYENICKPAINLAIENGLKISYFNLENAFKKNSSKQIEVKKTLIPQLYKFFTPENLFNKQIFVDSNKLNKNFYDELLYLMGLEEEKVDNKKVIKRLPVSKRQDGSFVENIISRLTIKDIPEELAYEYAVQLTVIWINRILFLKLLESQLVTYNKNDSYKFLTKNYINSFEDLWDLFFGVLAKRVDERQHNLRQKYLNVPYLNSSLFEEYELEKEYIGISNLRDQDIEFYPKTVIKDASNKRIKGKVPFLTYLFEFLNAYDFSTIERKVNNKNNLINASVLGLIFEKINGYKDGAFYTPGKITTYMSKNAVRKAVIDKYNERYKKEVKNIDDIKFNIRNLTDAEEVNDIINSLKICDPAVGSGHFLVSVLNELIAIKSELGVLLDFEGKSLNHYHCRVINDELIIKDINGDDFTYYINNEVSYRLQKSLFNEKRKIIENCLFGVDINSNSVNICRLRLWIELLKNSYYEFDKNSNSMQLVTLPNIDINIKSGDSLLYNIALDSTLGSARSKHLQFDEYYKLVSDYKNNNNKAIKRKLENKINEIKSTLRASFDTPEKKEIRRLTKNLDKLSQLTFFDSEDALRMRKSKIRRAEMRLKEARNRLKKLEENPLWKQAMEWRMEFPEVLNQDGEYVGFDLIIMNPPYIYSADEAFGKEEKKYFERKYPLNNYQANTFGLFFELAFQLLKPGGTISLIIPNSFLTVKQYSDMRKYLIEQTGDMFVLNSFDKIFEDASIDNCIITTTSNKNSEITIAELNKGEVNIINQLLPTDFSDNYLISISSGKSDDNTTKDILDTIVKKSAPLEPNFGKVKVGSKLYQRGKGKPKQIPDKEEFMKWKLTKPFESDSKLDDTYFPFIGGKEVNRYEIPAYNQYVQYGKHLAEPRNINIFSGKRLLIREISSKLPYTINSTYVEDVIINNQSAKTVIDLTCDGEFLVGILNSKVVSFWAVMKFDMLQRKTFPRFTTDQMRSFPIPIVSDDKQQELSNLVNELMKLINSDLSSVSNEAINQKNEEIDLFVAKLFGLSDEQIEYIEEIVSKK